jgi:hypothetical protein
MVGTLGDVIADTSGNLPEFANPARKLTRAYKSVKSSARTTNLNSGYESITPNVPLATSPGLDTFVRGKITTILQVQAGWALVCSVNCQRVKGLWT